MTRALPRQRRTALAVLAGAVLLALSGCAEPREAPDLDYPSAPDQRLPEAAAPAEVPAPGQPWVPIAGLADEQWLEAVAERTGIPQRALAAYTGAALLVAQTRPECGLGWNTLAGIGQVESQHGTYAGAEVEPDGQVSPAIIGIPLDGSPGFAEIPDTDGGTLDGDTQWDRAVGPMQFIPATWTLYAQDGSRSGSSDPHQYDDAALTAAVYLCESGGDLTSDEGWVDAVVAYNQSVEYVNDVAAHAQDYVSPDGP
ncbi:lytic transglycosylase domain-containing protein [Nesterenkonia sp. CF4.4]|uniref:lytic transglycosylase domain-containing protein n=1 Tax=Nesterenkonia sp. CF4.4 TaxID=3373079 RepID=UPI003EE7D27F